MKYGEKMEKKREWLSHFSLSLLMSVSFLSFCSYFCAVMDISASSSQTKDKLSIKDSLHAEGDLFVLSWPFCVLVIVCSQWISPNYLFNNKDWSRMSPATTVTSASKRQQSTPPTVTFYSQVTVVLTVVQSNVNPHSQLTFHSLFCWSTDMWVDMQMQTHALVAL